MLPKRIGKNFLLDEVDAWIKEQGLLPLTWDEVIKFEGGYGGKFYKTAEEAASQPWTHPGRWFASNQTDFDLYKEPYYVYSLLFGALLISRQAVVNFAKRHQNEEVNDVGGSLFTSLFMVLQGVPRVYVVNFGESPQLEFVRWFTKRHELEENIVVADEPQPELPTLMSEYLEHFERPVTEFMKVFKMVGEGVEIACANSFCMPAYGHFIPVLISDGLEEQRAYKASVANKLFSNMLKIRGFEIETVKMFNKSYIIAK